MTTHAGMMPRHHNIILSDHAWQRWQERSGVRLKRSKLSQLLAAKLNAAMAAGLALTTPAPVGWR